MVRRNQTNLPIGPPIRIFNDPVEVCKPIKYLGVKLNSRLTWKPHISDTVKKAKINKIKLQNLIGRKSTLKIPAKRRLYLATIRPIITYASASWAAISKNQFKPIETTQNTTLRQLVNADWFVSNVNIRNSLRIPKVKTFLKKLHRKFCIKNSESGPIKHLFDQILTEQDKDIKPICAMVFEDELLKNKFAGQIV